MRGVVDRHPCYSQFNIGASLHLIPWSGPVWDTSWHFKYLNILSLLIKSHLMADTGPGRGMRCDEALYWRSVNSKDASRSRLSHSTWEDEMKRYEWAECGEMLEWNLWKGKTGETPRKLAQSSPTKKPRGVNETRTRNPSAAVGGED